MFTWNGAWKNQWSWLCCRQCLWRTEATTVRRVSVWHASSVGACTYNLDALACELLVIVQPLQRTAVGLAVSSLAISFLKFKVKNKMFESTLFDLHNYYNFLILFFCYLGSTLISKSGLFA